MREGTIRRDATGRIVVWVRGRWVHLSWWRGGRRLTYDDLTEDEREARKYYFARYYSCSRKPQRMQREAAREVDV